MKIFKRPMRQVFRKGKLTEYVIGLGVNSDIDESRFHENDNGKIVCDVIVCFPDEYEKLMKDHEDLQTQRDELKKSVEKLQNQLSSIDEDHQKELEKIEKEYSGKIDQLKEDLHKKDIENEKEIGDLKEKYQSQIGDLKEKTQKDLNKLELFDEEYHMKISDHQNEVSGIKDKIVRETIHHNDNLNSLENSLNSLEDKLTFIGFIKGSYKSPLKELRESSSELKEDVKAFEYISRYIESKEEDVQEVKMKEDDE